MESRTAAHSDLAVDEGAPVRGHHRRSDVLQVDVRQLRRRLAEHDGHEQKVVRPQLRRAVGSAVERGLHGFCRAGSDDDPLRLAAAHRAQRTQRNDVRVVSELQLNLQRRELRTTGESLALLLARGSIRTPRDRRRGDGTEIDRQVGQNLEYRPLRTRGTERGADERDSGRQPPDGPSADRSDVREHSQVRKRPFGLLAQLDALREFFLRVQRTAAAQRTRRARHGPRSRDGEEDEQLRHRVSPRPRGEPVGSF